MNKNGNFRKKYILQKLSQEEILKNLLDWKSKRNLGKNLS